MNIIKTLKKIFVFSAFIFLLLVRMLAYADGQDQFRRNISIKHFNEGIRLEKSGELEKAIAEYEKSIDADPYNPYPFLNLGTIYFYRDDLILARYYYEISLKNDPSYQTAQNNLGWCDRLLTERGITNLEKAWIEAMQKGKSLFEKGHYSEAVTEFMKASGAMPEQGEAYRHLGKTLIKLKRFSLAERILSIAIKKSGTDHQMARFYADALEGKGDLGSALAIFETLLGDVEEKEERLKISARVKGLKKKMDEVHKRIAAFEKEFSAKIEGLSEESKRDLHEFFWKRISEGTPEKIIREEVLKALDFSFSETVFDNGLITVTFPAGWYQVLEETKPGSPLAVFRRWPGDTQLAFYSVESVEDLESTMELIKEMSGKEDNKIDLQECSKKPKSMGADRMASFQLDYDFEDVGTQTLTWWVFHFEECNSFCAVAALIGTGGLGKEEVSNISDELNSLVQSMSFRKNVWRLEEGIRKSEVIHFPLPPEFTGTPPFTEREMPWKVVQAHGFTLLVPPGVIGRRMDAVSSIQGRSTNMLWLKGEFTDNNGISVKMGDQEFFGYVDLFELENETQSAKYTLGKPEPHPPLSDPGSKFISGQDYTSIAKEAAACDYSWVGRFRGDLFSGTWLVFRMSYEKLIVEFGFPMVRGEESPSIFWIPTTFRVEGMPTALPPVDAAEKFNISFQHGSVSERRDPLGKEGDLYTPEFSVEIPSGWKPSINYRSIDGYPITVKEGQGDAFFKIIKLPKAHETEDAKRMAKKEICEECTFTWIPLDGVKKYRVKGGLQTTLEREEKDNLERLGIYIFETRKGDLFLLWESIPRKEWDSFANTAIKKAISSLTFK